jgi:hypothetical protein
MKAILVIQSNDSLLAEAGRYLADTLGAPDEWLTYHPTKDVDVVASIWATLRTGAPYMEYLVTLMLYVCAPEGTDLNAFMRNKFVNKQYKDSRVNLNHVEILPI